MITDKSHKSQCESVSVIAHFSSKMFPETHFIVFCFSFNLTHVTRLTFFFLLEIGPSTTLHVLLGSTSHVIALIGYRSSFIAVIG